MPKPMPRTAPANDTLISPARPTGLVTFLYVFEAFTRQRHSRINFVNDELRRRSRIRGSRDRTPDNEVIGSKTDRFTWSRKAFVIVG